jgi:hypothetical protein
MNIICELKNKLIKQNISLNTPATWQDVLAFEYKHQLKLSPVLSAYFLEFNGNGEGNMADDYFAFFSLAEFQPTYKILKSQKSDKSSHPNCFVFSDYMLWCWGYAVHLDQIGSDGAVYQVTGTNPPVHKVSNTFTEFLQQYLINSDELL